MVLHARVNGHPYPHPILPIICPHTSALSLLLATLLGSASAQDGASFGMPHGRGITVFRRQFDYPLKNWIDYDLLGNYVSMKSWQYLSPRMAAGLRSSRPAMWLGSQDYKLGRQAYRLASCRPATLLHSRDPADSSSRPPLAIVLRNPRRASSPPRSPPASSHLESPVGCRSNAHTRAQHTSELSFVFNNEVSDASGRTGASSSCRWQETNY